MFAVTENIQLRNRLNKTETKMQYWQAVLMLLFVTCYCSTIGLELDSNVTNTCKVTLNKTSALFLAKSFAAFQPNFARLQLFFNNKNVNYTSDVILPFYWVWTFNSLEGLFTYLQWPLDYPVLSLGLLDAKTLPANHFLVLEVEDDNDCSLTIGEPESTKSIAEALKHFTHTYIEPNRNDKFVDYSYWCYRADIPGIAHTRAYQLRVYTGYPIQITKYVCCHTEHNLINASDNFVKCDGKEYVQNLESSVFPYMLGVLAFIYFPMAFMKASGALIAISTPMGHQDGHLDGDELDLIGSPVQEEYVYLDGSVPISFTSLVGGMFGLWKTHPVLVSRFRRIVFVCLLPCLIYIRLFLYHKYLDKEVTALLKHNCPIGYISMLGGFQKSREVFLPALGGPFILLLSYYISSLFFIILPSDCNQIIEKGVPQENHTWDKSLLCFNVVTIDKYSHTLISNKVGYMKAYAFSSGSISMLTNPSYWSYVVKLQMNRLKAIYNLFCKKRIGFLLFIVVPCFIVFAIVEITLSVVFYGFPVINWMYIVMRGYTKTLVEMFRTQKVLSKVGHFTLLKLIFSFLIGIVFAYFVFSVCSIFIDSFVFLSEVLIFSFLAVLVYPSFSFGYLFFGIVLIYYVFKMIAGFGKDYAEFLADIVDACKELDNDPFGVQLVGDTIMVSDNRFNNVKKLQCNDMTIELTTQQRNAIRCSTSRKATWLHYKNHAVGVSKALFMKLVDVHRPIHIKIAQGILKLGLIVILILFTASVLRQKPHTVIKGISEVMHVVFVLVIGALPKILEIAIEHADHSVQKEILLRKLKVDIIRYIDSDAELVNVEH